MELLARYTVEHPPTLSVRVAVASWMIPALNKDKNKNHPINFRGLENPPIVLQLDNNSKATTSTRSLDVICRDIPWKDWNRR